MEVLGTRLPRRAGAVVALAGAGLLIAGLLAADARAHRLIVTPASDLSGWAAIVEFFRYGTKHIWLGYDHLLFLAGLALLTTGIRDVVEIAALFALAYSATLIGGTLAGLAVPGEPVDAIIGLSVGYVGGQIAFGAEGRWWLSRDPRGPALVFGLAHGLGLSSLLQELQLPGDALLASVIGFNLGVEFGQVAVLVAFVGLLAAVRAFPFPAREQIPAGCAMLAASIAFLLFLPLGVEL